MVRRFLYVCLSLFAFLGTTVATQAPAQKPGTADEQTLQQAKLGTNDDALFQLLARYTLADSDRATLRRLVGQLGSASEVARQSPGGPDQTRRAGGAVFEEGVADGVEGYVQEDRAGAEGD